MKWKYRLKKGARTHKSHEEWNECTDDQRKTIEATSPKRFEFESVVKAEVPKAAIVKAKAKKEKTEDK